MIRLQRPGPFKPLFRFLQVSRMKRDVAQSKVGKHLTATHFDDLRVYGIGVRQIKVVAQSEDVGNSLGRALQSGKRRFGRFRALILVQKNFHL